MELVGVNSRNIDDLHPTVARGCREFIRRMNEAGFPHIGISATYRDNTHQDWLHAQGRTRPGNIVTNARGGQSIHNYRLAFDFFRNIQGQAFNDRTLEERRFWDEAGLIWTKMGGMWGGNWQNFVDRPHCEYTGFLTLRDLQNGKRLPDNYTMPWEDEDMRIRDLNDVEEWARPFVQSMIDRNILSGRGEDGLDITMDMIRTWIISERMILDMLKQEVAL